MKVVINAVSAKMGGAVTYLTNVLRHLPPAETGHEFVVFLPPETAEKQQTLAPNIRLIPTNIGHVKWWKRLWWEQVTLRRQLKTLHGDVLFSTANFGMFCCPVRQILLVRIRLYFSKVYLERFLPLHSLKFRASFRLRRWLCCRSVRWADVVMTPTQAMMDELGVYVNVPPAKRLVNHYGVAKCESMGPVRELSAAGTGPVRLLYISLYAEHKNLRTLLVAMPLINEGEGSKFELVTTVNPSWKVATWTQTHRDDIELAKRPDVAPWVKFVGPLGRKEVEEQYGIADIVVFPALTESFGHPMVEAMGHGLPIVAADTPVNREICGDAAIYFSPLDPENLAQAVQRVAMNASLRERLSLEGRRRAHERFRWDAHVRRILETARAGNPAVIPDPRPRPLLEER